MKKIKISEKRLQQLIQEEAKRQKRILDLTSKREEIKKHLNEMYGQELNSQENDIDEINFKGLGQKLKDVAFGGREEWKKKYLDWIQKVKMANPNVNFEIPQGEDLEAAVDAMIRAQDFKVKKHNGVWVPISHVGDTSGG